MTGTTSETTLRVSRTHFPVTALGPGKRLGLWVQGCPLACRGCMARDTWNAAAGESVSLRGLLDRWLEAVARGATGLTVSGGEPLAQPRPLAEFLRAVRRIGAQTGSEHDILLYTGYEPAELDAEQWRAAQLADVLITGRFEAGQPTRLVWRGSANQRMTPQSALGRRLYAEHLDRRPDRIPVQLTATEDGLWLVGVPQRGALPRLDRTLRARGLAVGQASWRAAAEPGFGAP